MAAFTAVQFCDFQPDFLHTGQETEQKMLCVYYLFHLSPGLVVLLQFGSPLNSRCPWRTQGVPAVKTIPLSVVMHGSQVTGLAHPQTQRHQPAQWRQHACQRTSSPVHGPDASGSSGRPSAGGRAPGWWWPSCPGRRSPAKHNACCSKALNRAPRIHEHNHKGVW